MRNLVLVLVLSTIILLGLGFTIFKLFGKNNQESQNLSKQQDSPLSQSATSPISNDASQTTVIAENLDTPWGIAFLPASPAGGPDKNMLVTERAGRVRLIDNSGKLQSEPVGVIGEVREVGEGGLLGIALHPDFSTNNFVYLYYTYSALGDDTLNRVVRMKYQNGILSNEEVIVDKIPGASNHNGGRIKFGPDKALYITTGDAQEPSLSQDKNSLAGKILRAAEGGRAEVYSYGHRNPQGLAWDSDGKLWSTEHGRSGVQSGLDELNLIEKGKNYGWPTIQGTETKVGMETPKLNSGPDTTWAPAGAAFLPAGRQGVKDSIFFGGLRGQTLYQAVIQNSKVIDFKEHFKGQFGRIRDVVLGPDNMLYITTSNKDGRGNPASSDDRIIKINPQKL